MGQIYLSTSEKTEKISEAGFAKTGHTAVSKPQWFGFSNTKTDYDKLESWENFFTIPLLGLISPKPPLYSFSCCCRQV